MARKCHDLSSTRAQDRDPEVFDRGEQHSNISKLEQHFLLKKQLYEAHSNLEAVLDAIRLDNGDALNINLIREIRGGASDNSILAAARQIVKKTKRSHQRPLDRPITNPMLSEIDELEAVDAMTQSASKSIHAEEASSEQY
ncbi:hypothetical protein BGW36DRAFT_410417 [Talaromyces proteolyticus]|uniref:Uncharacterized protein n=1 Tax=Talaromyces proteolyticus TaxID=1131652 RepID=A0AAD4PVU7_9EURO|nr:uncharacterized protein BGW36DRAFT_410417 [Talaromyces proteolyticus]KAH8691813.1 hypothetical protein BGW36DRAFT_410417 [Talaromyces proteolyticus]